MSHLLGTISSKSVYYPVWGALWITELRQGLWPLYWLSSKECWIMNYILNQRFPFTRILYFPRGPTWFIMLSSVGEVCVTLVFFWEKMNIDWGSSKKNNKIDSWKYLRFGLSAQLSIYSPLHQTFYFPKYKALKELQRPSPPHCSLLVKTDKNRMNWSYNRALGTVPGMQ